MENSKKGSVPLLHGKTLSKSQCPATAEDRELMNKIPCASAIGSVMYAMRSEEHTSELQSQR